MAVNSRSRAKVTVDLKPEVWRFCTLQRSCGSDYKEDGLKVPGPGEQKEQPVAAPGPSKSWGSGGRGWEGAGRGHETLWPTRGAHGKC